MNFKDSSFKSSIPGNTNSSNHNTNSSNAYTNNPNQNNHNIQKPHYNSTTNDGDCIFCKIINHQISVRSVFEDDYIIAILDINPANKGHVLVIPKKHYTVIPQIDNDIVKHIFVVCKKISKAVIGGLKADGTNIYTACGGSAGQTSQHALIHIIPRFKDDDLGNFSLKQTEISDKELESVREMLI